MFVMKAPKSEANRTEFLKEVTAIGNSVRSNAEQRNEAKFATFARAKAEGVQTTAFNFGVIKAAEHSYGSLTWAKYEGNEEAKKGVEMFVEELAKIQAEANAKIQAAQTEGTAEHAEAQAEVAKIRKEKEVTKQIKVENGYKLDAAEEYGMWWATKSESFKPAKWMKKDRDIEYAEKMFNYFHELMAK